MSTASLSPDADAQQPGELRKVALNGYVGFDEITKQVERNFLRRGFAFNVMLVGASGLGKSTFVNTLFNSHLVDSRGGVRAGKTTEIAATSQVLEENGVRMRLTIVDTPGFGDQVNNESCWEPVLRYIKDQYSGYLRKELTPYRERRIPDTRVHCVLYFISPTGHALRPIDITVMRKLGEISNVVPVIAKSDSLTVEERLAFKRRIKEEIDFHGVRTYPFLDEDVGADVSMAVAAGSAAPEDRAERAMSQMFRDMVPFAIVGSERNVVVDGKAVRGRRNRWGIVNVEDEKHCEFVHLRNFLTRTHLFDLIDTTGNIHYENYRTKQLLALKESAAQQ